MRTIKKEYKVYKFNELPEKAKTKVLEKLWDINVDDSFWYEHYQDTAKELGFTLDGFDLGRGGGVDLDFVESPETICERIVAFFGDTESIHTFAKNAPKISEEYSNDDFIKELGEEYLCLLRRAYEYLTSEESVIESIEANDYEFREDGTLE